jgi:hypothetical protein
MHQGSDPMVNTDAKRALLGEWGRALSGGSMLSQKIFPHARKKKL